MLARQEAENVAGVIDVAQLTGQVVQEGIGRILALIALSAILALMNLLPIPVL